MAYAYKYIIHYADESCQKTKYFVKIIFAVFAEERRRHCTFPLGKIFLEPETNVHVCNDKKYQKSRQYVFPGIRTPHRDRLPLSRAASFC